VVSTAKRCPRPGWESVACSTSAGRTKVGIRRPACKPSRHNVEKFVGRKRVYCLGQSQRGRRAGRKGGHTGRELERHVGYLHRQPRPAGCTLLSGQAADTAYRCEQPELLLPRVSEMQISEQFNLEETRGSQVWGISLVLLLAQSGDSVSRAEILLGVSFSQVRVSPRKEIVQTLQATHTCTSPSTLKVFSPFL